jgi:hypothetical protein
MHHHYRNRNNVSSDPYLACWDRRRSVSVLMAHLEALTNPPRRITLRHVHWEQHHHHHQAHHQNETASHGLLVVAAIRFYFLPQNVMDEWTETVDWMKVVRGLCAHSIDIQHALFRIP